MADKKKLKKAKFDADALVDKAKKQGKKALKATKEKAEEAAEKAQEGYLELKKAVYCPVFPEDYVDPKFESKQLVAIVTEGDRKDVDVCEGAIGWINKRGKLDVFNIYDDAVQLSGLKFYPAPSCYSIYLRDKFDTDLYVDLSCYLETMEQDRIAELMQIAHKLGAKHCKLESREETKAVSMVKGKAKRKLKLRDKDTNAEFEGSLDASAQAINYREAEILFEQTFEGNAAPQMPELKWFQHDKGILNLIEARCNAESNAPKTYCLSISSKASKSMALSLAEKVDATLKKIGASFNFSIEGEIREESRKKLFFEITF